MNYNIKDSWERVKFESWAQRDTSVGKPRYDLISPFALKRIANHMAKWALKYSERNREKWIPIERCYESALRHVMQYAMWEEDEDHLSAAIFNLMAIIHFQECKTLEKN